MGDYNHRVGTSSTLGITFENKMIQYLAVAACNQKDVEDFWMAINADGVEALDDIILYTKASDGKKQLKFLQLKHKEQTDTKFLSFNGIDFVKYVKSIAAIQNLMSASSKNVTCAETKAFIESTEVDFKDMEFIFLTNRSIKANDKHFLPVYKDTFIKSNPDAANSIYRIKEVSEATLISKFVGNNAHLKPKCNSFLERFFIYANQSGVTDNALSESIQSELTKYIANDAFTSYQFVEDEFEKALSQDKFTKHGQKITLAITKELLSACILLTFKHEKPLQDYLLIETNEWDTFLKLIQNYQLVIFTDEDAIFRNFFAENNSHHFIKCDGHFNDLVIDCLKMAKDKKIVWLVSKDSIEAVTKKLSKANISTLYSLNDFSQESLGLLSHFNLTIQGRKTTFQKLLAANPGIKDILTVDDILNLLANRLKVGERICENPEYYVSRTIPKIFVNKTIIFTFSESYFILAVEDDLQEAKLRIDSYLKTNSRHLNLVKDNTQKILENENANFHIVRNDQVNEIKSMVKDEFEAVHILKYYKYERDFALEWISSNTKIHEVDQFVEQEPYNIQDIQNSGNELYFNSTIDRVLIVANPGMGKTYLTKYIANNYPVDAWVILITLTEINFKSVQSFQTLLQNYADKLNTSIKSKKVFDVYLKNKCIAVLFDGFDEIAPHNEKLTLQFIKDALKQKFKIIVTSRKVTKSVLERNLNALAYTLNPFSANDKEQFLQQFYFDNIRENLTSFVEDNVKDKIKIFTNKLLEKCLLSQWDEEFTGVPLQCRLLAEGFIVECQIYCEKEDEAIIPKSLNIHSMYEHFIERKFKIHIEEKEKLQGGNTLEGIIKGLKDIFFERHLHAAVQIIFPDVGIKISDIYLTEIESGHEKHGIITGLDENKKPIFIHRTFAEYFAAKWLVQIKEQQVKETDSSTTKNSVKRSFKLIGSKNRQQQTFLHYLLKPQNNVVRDLFDKILCKNCHLHIAVLNCDVTTVKKILEKNGGRDESKCGRNYLHLIAARGAQHERVDGEIERKGEEQYLEVLNVLLENSACCDEKDEVLRWTAIQYAERRDAFGIIDKILQFQEKHLHGLKNTLLKKWRKEEILEICSKYDYVNLAMHVLKLQELDKSEAEDLLHKCVINDSVWLAEKLIWCKRMDSKNIQQIRFTNYYLDDGTLLHVAAEYERVKIIDLLVEHMDVNIQDKNGKTPLYIACDKMNLSAIKKLVEKGGNLFIPDNHGELPMDIAIWKGNRQLVKYVTSYDVLERSFGNLIYGKVSTMNQGLTALHYAAIGNNWSTLQKLLSKGANVNNKDDNGNTVLHHFCQNGNFSAVKKMVKKGGNLILANNDGYAPIDLALASENLELIEYVTSSDVLKIAFVNNPIIDCDGRYAKLGDHLSTIEKIIMEGANVKITDNNGDSVLHHFCRNQHLSLLKKSVENGGNLFLQNNEGETPMDLALKSGNGEFIEYVTSYDVLKTGFGNDINTKLPGKYNECTALQYAVKYNNIATAERLLSEEANVNVPDAEGNAPLHYFCQNINLSTVKKLLENDGNLFLSNNYGSTPMDYAFEGGNRELVEYLTSYDVLKIGFGKDVNAALPSIEKGTTALHLAVKGNNLLSVEKLILRGANVNITDEHKNTALHEICKQKWYNGNMMRCLVESGANINAQNLRGETALHWAIQSRNKQYIELLLVLGADANIMDDKELTAQSIIREWRKVGMPLSLYEKTKVMSEGDALHKSVLTNGTLEEVRRATFVGFPQELTHLVDSMVQSGFCYMGFDDEVQCSKCQCWCKNWQPTDDPWDRHAKKNPLCPFLIQEKGLLFVLSCQSDSESSETESL